MEIKSKEVSWDVIGVRMYGTITGPSDNKKHPAIVFVAGSGPTDRDWCSPLLRGENGSARLLADFFAENGFITLRYDKFGSGPHVKEDLPKLIGKVSMQIHVDELGGAVNALLSEKNVDKKNLFVLGNSEGTIHAVNYQLQAKANRFKGLILTGAPGRAIGEVARSQILNQLNSLSGDSAFSRFFTKIGVIPDKKRFMESYDEATANFLAGKSIQSKLYGGKAIRRLLRSLENPANQPFSRELWTYDLTKNISKIKSPILILIGKKDIQTDWKIDGEALKKATNGNPKVSFAFPNDSNHLLKYEKMPRNRLNARYVGRNYNSPRSYLDRSALNAIYSWLIKQTKS